ncbi:ATP synthase subunit b, mitochondrial-like [Hyposmocoma kahamanoa]|uniref:ATP synthase subunit b, mitochondrial-like n=1 Tax=Hyposmocoma kahamanoa TaxID=1477025 RepID=UPI000E6D8CC7|nr:ATP synthase subunit b, mitochondrial-like [Hyposmocoma kahamanoa]
MRATLLRRKLVNLFVRPCLVHSQSCPAQRSDDGGGFGTGKKRAERCAPVKLAVIPAEWFTFFHVKTGVSGGYVLLFVLTNYALSKEIFVMEHEYYAGLSIFLMLYYVTTKLGPGIGASLDKEVDDIVDNMYKGRKAEIAHYESVVKEANDAVWRAEGQQLLIAAKKENVLMQLEAVYRERMMHAYHMVKGRMDYHMKRYYSEARIHQKWMINWILKEVHKAITPEFEQEALNKAIKDLEAAASKAA